MWVARTTVTVGAWRLAERCESALFVERLPCLEAVMRLAEEAVEQVTLGGVVPVAVPRRRR
ncbi:hypothetical protein SNOD_12990 [Streptomyces nodosus]|uniref:Uncharacterized protein n=1 Tax=Streptomyces nodosus TaxID=40318 RepID=A0A0B5DB78_9ACTN|nr:hypothetical protein SNOD_12990 [Streptomyces nodosus]